jgi:hypothetical protein
VAAGAGDGGQRQVQRGLAAGGGDAGHAAFERGDAFFEHGIGRIRDARIDVARALHIEQRRRMVGVAQGERGREVDGRGACAGGRVGAGAGVQRQGIEAGIAGTAHDGCIHIDEDERHPTTKRTPGNPSSVAFRHHSRTFVGAQDWLFRKA